MINDYLKRFIDVAGSSVALLIFFPAFIAISILVKISSPGPILFRQLRLGINGKPFEMLKFRTMHHNTEESGTGLFSYKDDPRITKVGNFLRKASLDEIPQLINVLGGSMSLVGPRPPVTYELGKWEEYTENMKIRFEVKPGITGLAQISGRNELDWDTKIQFDNKYVSLYKKWGVLIDMYIFLKTIWVVILGRNTIEERSSLEDGPVARKAKEAITKR